MRDDPADPPTHTKAAIVLSSFGWLVGALASAGCVAWCRALRRTLTGRPFQL